MVKRLFTPVDIAPLVYARIVFGVMMFVEVVRYLVLGRVRRYYIDADFLFTFWGFDWVKPLPGVGMYVVSGVLMAAALCIVAGLFFRAAAALFAVGITYLFLLDQTHYLNHMYLICLASGLLCLTPAADAGSLDALRRKASRQWAPLWAVALIPAQLALVYFFGGIAKLDLDWLQGIPARRFLRHWPDVANEQVFVYALAWGGLLFDLLIVPALLYRRTRWFATAGAIVFHLSNATLFKIGIFPWLMMGMTPLFWPRSFARRILAWLRVLPKNPGPQPRPSEFRPHRGLVAALGVYATIQFSMPLRHWLYPGQVNWTEEGHNFAWHMKLRSKDGKILFVVHDKKSGQDFQVDPHVVINRRQVSKMSTRPDMILLFAHELGRSAVLKGMDPEVRATAVASLNGRPFQYLIYPEVDLLQKQRGIAHADWIVPLGGGPAVQPQRTGVDDDVDG